MLVFELASAISDTVGFVLDDIVRFVFGDMAGSIFDLVGKYRCCDLYRALFGLTEKPSSAACSVYII